MGIAEIIDRRDENDTGKDQANMSIASFQRKPSSLLQTEIAACESVKQVIDIAVTAEALAVTALGGAIANAENGLLALNDEQIEVLKAARVAEQAHYEYLAVAGAEPLTTTFTIPDPAIVTDVPTFLSTIIALEEAFIAAYMAAAQVFTYRKQPELAQIAVSVAAVEAEHRAHARFYAIQAGLLEGVPNNYAFAPAMFTSVGEAAAALQSLGFIGGDGQEITYPGPGEIENPGVINLRPS
ncbi:hypothetical protein BH23CHL2_BH23CHL2_09150 [soil metagenome]